MADLIGCEEPRIYTPPLRPLTPQTSYGFSVISFAEDVLGVRLFPWQKFFFIHALEANEDGTFRFRIILLLISRQNGKSTMARVFALWALFVFGVSLVLGTAQNLDTSEETWEGAVEMVEDNPQLSEELEQVVRVNGKKAMRLRGNHSYRVAASSRRGARGKTADVVILDELREHLTFDAWGAVTKTTNAKPNALILCLSNAGDAFSVVLRHLRYMAHMQLGDPDGWCAAVGDMGDGEDPEDGSEQAPIGIFEWSAPPSCSKWDRDGWRQANPSMGYGTITERVIASDAATDPEAVFRTEDLCQWVESIREEPFPEGAWDSGVDPQSQIADGSPLAFGVDVSPERTWASIAVAGDRADGSRHVEIVARRAGFEWVIRWIAERAERASAEGRAFRFAYQQRGAAVSSIADQLSSIPHADAHEISGRDLAAYCGRLYDGVSACGPDASSDARRVMHRPQPVLDTAAHTAAKKTLGDGAFVFDRSSSPEDASPLMACAMALGLLTAKEDDGPRKESAYSEDRGMMVV